MRIVVNDIAASTGGALTILKDFYNYIDANDKENEWIFILGDKYLQESKNIKVIVREDVKKNWSNRILFDLIQGKKFIKSLNPDSILSLQNTIINGLKIPQVVYIHQSIPFQKYKRFSFLKRSERVFAIYQYIIGYIIKKSARQANAVIIQTDWMKNVIAKDLNVNEDNIYVVRPKIPDVDIKIKVGNVNNKQFFYPADSNIYKNHKCIFEASKILQEKNINGFSIELTINHNELNTYDDVCIKYLGKIPRDYVLDKLSKSVLIFPSYIETVGLPLLEAMKLETIIIVADCEYSREVTKGYANVYYFNPFNSYELATIMENIINKSIVYKHNKSECIYKSDSWNDVINILCKYK